MSYLTFKIISSEMNNAENEKLFYSRLQVRNTTNDFSEWKSTFLFSQAEEDGKNNFWSLITRFILLIFTTDNMLMGETSVRL